MLPSYYETKDQDELEQKGLPQLLTLHRRAAAFAWSLLPRVQVGQVFDIDQQQQSWQQEELRHPDFSFSLYVR